MVSGPPEKFSATDDTDAAEKDSNPCIPCNPWLNSSCLGLIDSNSVRSFARFTSSIRSSASIQKIHSPVACRMHSFRAAAKSSHQGKSKTLAPKLAATSFVRSVEPVSMTMISLTRSAADCKQPGSAASSFLTIKAKETWFFIVSPWQGMAGRQTFASV